MTTEIKVGRLARDLSAAPVEIRSEESEPLRLRFPLSSEAPVERFFGTEVLSHDDGAIRMDRLKAGAVPLLFNHNWDDPIGVVDSGNVVEGRLFVDAHLFDTERAREVATMVRGGLRNVSVGYQINSVDEPEKGSSIYVSRDWTPLEASIVTVPADFQRVGIGREQDDTATPVRIVRAAEVSSVAEAVTDQPAAAAAQQGELMSSQQSAAAAQPAEPQVVVERRSAAELERERQQAALAMGRAANAPEPIIQRWMLEGTPLTQVAADCNEIVEARHRNAKPIAAEIGMTSKETQRYSLFRAIRAMRYQNDRKFAEDAAFELECSQAVRQKLGRPLSSSIFVPSEVLSRPLGEGGQRAMATVPGASGGYLVGTTNAGFIDILRNRSVAMAMGARVLSGLQGNVTFARQTAKPSVTWQAGDNVSVTAADQTLGQLSMTPKTCIAITDVSEQLLAQSDPSAEAFVMADLARDVAIDGVDNAVINGTGGAQPIGIKNTVGITSGQDASSATYAKILAFVSTAAGANAIRGNPGWVTNAAGAAVLMQKARFSNTDTPLWTGNIMDGQCVGFRAMSSEQLASSNLIFGSWDEVVIGEWGVLELSTDNGGTRFNTATVGIRAMWMVDVMLRYPQAFVVSVNLGA